MQSLTIRIALVGLKNIHMPALEGVVDLHNNGGQAAIAAFTEPKAHRLKGITKHAGEGGEPDLTVRIMNACNLKLVFCPLEQWSAITMVP